MTTSPAGYKLPPTGMNCPKCGLENPDTARFCMRCGKELETGQTLSPDEVRYCYRHPKEATQLSCGRCDRPLCTKCVVIGPAGPRCPDCAKLKIPLRPGAVVHEAKRGVLGIFRSGPWTVYVWIMIIMMVLGLGRGCVSSFGRHEPPQAPPPVSSDE